MAVAKPQVVSEPRRRKLPKAAAAELHARYRLRNEAEQRLVDYLWGVCLSLGLKPGEVAGFDETTGELLLTAE